jgi:hypothetical protein
MAHRSFRPQAVRSSRCLPGAPRRLRAALAALVLLAHFAPALAQPTLRSTFPGRRIGGGTRGECSARLLAHLVPADSVFAPGPGLTVALLEGPSANPRPVKVQFRPQGPGGIAAGAAVERLLPASGAGVTLLTISAFKASQVWESSYRCGDSDPVSGDPLNFVASVSPPALSLLVTDVTAADRTVQAGLQRLKGLCGSKVARDDLARSFALEDVIDSTWAELLPVRCR